MKAQIQTLTLVASVLLVSSCHTPNHFTRPPSRDPFTNACARAEYERGYGEQIQKGLFWAGDGANGLRDAYALGADDAYHDKATFLKLTNYHSIYDDARYMRQRQASIEWCEKEMKKTSQPAH
jgi:hypothetical protein